jgi:serine/threonine-protein kinase
MLAVINAAMSPGFWWVFFPMIGIGYGIARRMGELWADGIPLRNILKSPERPGVRGDEQPLRRLEAKLPAPPANSMAEAVLDAVPRDVLESVHGAAVREAYEARAKIRSTLARLPEGDRSMLPEIQPTVEALVERVRTLAIALHALDVDASPEALVKLEARISAAEAMPEAAPERARRLELLLRQRQTLQDLAERRATLLQQLEQAVLLLGSMQLDLMKLRSSGVSARLADDALLTSEMRALSRDVERVAEAVEEARDDSGRGAGNQ